MKRNKCAKLKIIEGNQFTKLQVLYITKLTNTLYNEKFSGLISHLTIFR